ncbi:MAG TPA: protein kinase [Vicinamibacterales bacterium]|nr:protein kinase [Vicinamibacterales bacterium]
MPLAVTTAVLTPPPQTVIALTQPSQTPLDDAPTDGATIVSTAPRSATGPLHVGQAFGARYHIIRVLGVGGMGAVYHAWDAELGMAVALKVIRPETSIDPVTAQEMERRFKQELVLARQVTHKNVVRIHDLGEISGIKYITMPYLDGSDLATKLKERSKLPVPEALSIVRDVAAGLAAAHEAGIVHRDLKPANIMILSDHAVIMDFGIARSAGNVSAAAAPSSAPVTGTATAAWQTQGAATTATVAGAILGTVHYMAPEQARGEVVDQRADVYAFGLIFSDMLLGIRRSENAVAELKRRMEAAPPPVRATDPSIPAAVETLIGRCLEPDPAARFQTSAELVAALDALDEQGEPIPIKRVVRLPVVVGVVAMLLVVSGGIWWYQRSLIPPAPHDPVSVVIADFQNGTNDVTFDRTLEPMLKRALEGANFISAYDRNAISGTLGVRPPERLDEQAARELAVRQGLGVVLSGAVTQQGNGYQVSVKAVQTVSGTVITSADGRAATKDQVLGVATRLVTEVRKALGDDTSDSAQLFAMETLSTTSLDVVRHFAAALEASTNNRFADAFTSFSKAVELDPKFGAGYIGMAAMSRNLGRPQEAQKYTEEALRYLDGMTERERFNARGMLYLGIGDYQQCVKEYTDLVNRFSGDVYARNRLAICATHLRDMREAVQEMKEVVKFVPKRAIFRVNLALYESYGGDFQAGEQEARGAQDLGSPLGLLPLAFAKLGQGLPSEASETYQALGQAEALGTLGASFAASGLGDLAVYEGRFADARRVLEAGAAADLKANAKDRAAAKFASLGYAQLLRGQPAAAAAAAESALANSEAVKIRFLAGRLLIEANRTAAARPLITALSSETQPEPRAYAKILEGDVLLKSGDARQAIARFGEANSLLDTWIGHFDLGRAYLEAGLFAQADSEFDRCLTRRGEALALFIDEEPTYGYLPAVYYYQGRAREGLKTERFADSYREYIKIRGNSKEDPLLAEVQRRAGR